MSTFSVKEVRKIAKLASLELTSEEEQEFAQQFGTILEYFERTTFKVGSSSGPISNHFSLEHRIQFSCLRISVTTSP